MQTPLNLEETDIVVLPHAVEQARARFALSGSDTELRHWIADGIRRASSRREIFDAKPRRFRGVGQTKNGRMVPGQRIATVDDTAFVIDIAWYPKKIEVITVLKELHRVSW